MPDTNTQTDVRALICERLCEHHDVSKFDCDDETYNLLIKEARRTSAFGAEKDAWFVVHHGDHRVVGFICIGPGLFQDTPAIWVSALATDISVRSSARPATALIRKFAAVADALSGQVSHLHGPYKYDVVIGLNSNRVSAGLRRAGFTLIDDTIWVRPRST